jgi:hypothetical protein
MPKGNSIYRAFGDGIQARKQEHAMTANPYPARTPRERRLREAWLHGWETEDRFIRKNMK